MSTAARTRPSRWSALLGMVVGGIVVAGAVFVWFDVRTRRSWPQVEGEIVRWEVVTASRDPNRSSIFRATFRYQIDGVSYESVANHHQQTDFHSATIMSLKYGSGTRHRLWYRPGNPREITFAIDDRILLLGPSMALFAGFIILIVGVSAWYDAASPPP